MRLGVRRLFADRSGFRPRGGPRCCAADLPTGGVAHATQTPPVGKSCSMARLRRPTRTARIPLSGTSGAQRSEHAQERPKNGRFHVRNSRPSPEVPTFGTLGLTSVPQAGRRLRCHAGEVPRRISAMPRPSSAIPSVEKCRDPALPARLLNCVRDSARLSGVFAPARFAARRMCRITGVLRCA